MRESDSDEGTQEDVNLSQGSQGTTVDEDVEKALAAMRNYIPQGASLLASPDFGGFEMTVRSLSESSGRIPDLIFHLASAFYPSLAKYQNDYVEAAPAIAAQESRQQAFAQVSKELEAAVAEVTPIIAAITADAPEIDNLEEREATLQAEIAKLQAAFTPIPMILVARKRLLRLLRDI